MGVEFKVIIVGFDVEIIWKFVFLVEMYIKFLVFKWEMYLYKFIEVKYIFVEGSLKFYLLFNN